jgi:hypothetical protein
LNICARLVRASLCKGKKVRVLETQEKICAKVKKKKKMKKWFCLDARQSLDKQANNGLE